MDEDEPELWVLDGDDAGAGIGDDDTGASPDAPGGPATPALESTLTSEDVAGDDWADTSWLDDLMPQPGPTSGSPAGPGARPAVGGADARTNGTGPGHRTTSANEFAGLRSPTTPPPGGTGPTSTPPGPGGNGTHAAPTTNGDAPAAGRSRRARSAARNDEVSEFLRELSRLALDDD